MSELIEIEGQYYIRSTSSMADTRTFVLKHEDTFAVFDRYGDIQPVGLGEQGIFHEGTRYLSSMVLTINGQRPLLLSSNVRRNNAEMVVDLTNPDLTANGGTSITQDTLHIHRARFLWEATCYERLTISNFGARKATVRLGFEIDADFCDIFEIRGQRRPRRGVSDPPAVGDYEITIGYTGLDDVRRLTRVTSVSPASSVTASGFTFDINLSPHQEEIIDLEVSFGTGSLPRRLSHDEAQEGLLAQVEKRRTSYANTFTSNEQFNDWLNQSLEDLTMLKTETVSGLYPYAGVPWYSTAFGRDGIITAMQMLWVAPHLARSVLQFLADTQATTIDPVNDAEPGKIFHETRLGEMAATGEIPFGMYYGSVDATPLFVMLAGHYAAATGDMEFIETIWPNIKAALDWVEQYGDLDGDGFVEYKRKNDAGLINQGWKDSFDSVFHEDGTQAEPPIAICEMQAYVYAARIAAARLADLLGHSHIARNLRHAAHLLQEKFEERFWDDELETYVLALDGEKRPCRVPSSNAGHVLFSGIASEERAEKVVRTLMAPASFSGWGIRTIAAGAERYNPMSYHNGSVWPHDNALIAAGFARYGHQEAAAEVLTGMFNASIFVDLHRLPELFCGFPKRPGEGPTLYPVACSPQAWAAGTVFMLLQASLGMTIDACANELRFTRSVMPEYLSTITISNLKVGTSTLDVRLQRGPNDVGVNVLRNDGDTTVVVVK